MPELKTKPEWLRAMPRMAGTGIGVDRENKVIRGVILAEEGPFKTPGRGEFDAAALAKIVELGQSLGGRGLKARWTHPTLSGDGLGTFLGRYPSDSIRLDTVVRDNKAVQVVRGDLHLSPTAFEGNPNGNLGDYVLKLAEEDSDAFATSLVLKTDEQYRLNDDGTPKLDADGEPLPPLWRPTELHGSDVVDVGDATNSFLSADILSGLPDAAVRQGAELLDSVFAGQSREVVQARATAWLSRYLDFRFGDEPKTEKDFAPAQLTTTTTQPDSKPQQLGVVGGIVPGDLVEWFIEFPDQMMVRQECGKVLAVGGGADALTIPGTDVSMEGNELDPPVLVQHLDRECLDADDDDDDDPMWYLVRMSALQKLIILGEAPTRGGGDGYAAGAYMGAESDDEMLMTEIDILAREVEAA